MVRWTGSWIVGSSCALALSSACGAPAGGDDAPVEIDASAGIDAEPEDGPDASPPAPTMPRVYYVADQDTDGAFDLYVAEDGVSTRVSGPVEGGEYAGIQWSRTVSRAVYLVQGGGNGAYEAVTVDLTAASPAGVTLNGPLVQSGLVGRAVLAPDGSRAVYSAYREVYGRFDLHLVDLSTGTPSLDVRLNDPADTLGRGVMEARWSPDGTHVAFHTELGPRELFVVDVTATAPAPIPVHDAFTGDGVWEEEFAWSPDGRWLVYLARQDGSDVHELYAVDMSGSAPAAPRKLHPTITDHRNRISNFSWSPDGDWLVYRTETSACTACEVNAVKMSGAEPAAPVPVNPSVDGVAVQPQLRWAPDSSALAYQVTEGPVTQLHVTAFSGTAVGASSVVNGPIVAGGTVHLATPGTDTFRWSPDSGRLAYVAREHEPSQAWLYVARVVDGVPLSAEVVSHDLPFPNEVTPPFSWTPDSRQLVYLTTQTAVEDAGVFVVGVGGAAPVVPARINGPLVDGGTIPYTGAYDVPFVLLGDGEWVAYRSDAEVDERFEVYASHIATGTPTVPIKRNGPLVDGGDVLVLLP